MLHASALCTSHYRNMLSQSEAMHDIENTRGSPYESKTVLRSRRLVVQNPPDVWGLIKNTTALDMQLLTGLVFISMSYWFILNILSKVLRKIGGKSGIGITFITVRENSSKPYCQKEYIYLCFPHLHFLNC